MGITIKIPSLTGIVEGAGRLAGKATVLVKQALQKAGYVAGRAIKDFRTGYQEGRK